jgi:hypothetical protein
MRKPLNTIGLFLIVLLALSLGRCTPGSYPVVLSAAVDQFAVLPTPSERQPWGELGTPEATAWLRAGAQGLRDSLVVPLPFRETGVLTDSLPLALSYRVTILPGRQLLARLDGTLDAPGHFLLDAWVIDSAGHTRRRAVDAAGEGCLSLPVTTDTTTLLVRVQAPIGASGQFTLQLDTQPTLLEFPVKAYGIDHVTSLWGQPRDGGKRRHEGIDVPAPIGTPVVASADGVVMRVDSNGWGGRFITLAVPNLGVALYYAHLDQQLVRVGRKVRRGQVLGTVGVTGNADTLVPHLHFGIYTGLGAVDPYPFLDSRPGRLAAESGTPSVPAGTLARVLTQEATLRHSPDPAAAVIRELHPNELVHVAAATGRYLRVVLPDGSSGYLSARRVQAITEQPREVQLRTATALLATPGFGSVGPLASGLVAFLPARESIRVLGRYGEYDFVQARTGRRGWIRRVI